MTSWGEVFTEALRGAPCRVHGWGPSPWPLPVAAWGGHPDASDRAVLAMCTDVTLDVGCGPGRMAQGLVRAGTRAVGIDVVAEAVHQTRRRGVVAMRRDVFDPIPGEGGWGSVLLADGNVGIGGDPVRLLRRTRDLLADTGRAVVDVAPPGVGTETRRVHLECRGRRSEEFSWAVVGTDDVPALARAAGFSRTDLHEHHGRWFALLSGRLDEVRHRRGDR